MVSLNSYFLQKGQERLQDYPTLFQAAEQTGTTDAIFRAITQEEPLDRESVSCIRKVSYQQRRRYGDEAMEQSANIKMSRQCFPECCLVVNVAYICDMDFQLDDVHLQGENRHGHVCMDVAVESGLFLMNVL